MISLRTVPFAIAGVLLTAFSSAMAILASYLRNAEPVMHTISQLWARFLFSAGGIEFGVIGEEHIPEDPAYIIMANHKSHLDPPLFIASFPHHIRFLAKRELFAIPVFGRALRRIGHISINRKNLESARRSLRKAGEKIRTGTTLLAFPEGTRYSQPGLGPFKKGPFHLARESRVPILPAWVKNSEIALPAGSVRVRAVPVTAYLGKPVQPEEYENLSLEETMALVRGRIEELEQKANH